ncbi:hypothetical protein RMSM_01260 [Rhodopirellula maiorica SM1]|uniref:Uncharacterized protein n=1 Tax=Rhodopirellula maiorica SM1 TaxID=1265738 RepID=M5RRK0_9BACT|nr:hypothetical protein [Rhodopirellula maiorica]EMI21821.1 hypothetical protein RMSM_01260 [Rhodopirellula maiorica SM1]
MVVDSTLLPPLASEIPERNGARRRRILAPLSCQAILGLIAGAGPAIAAENNSVTEPSAIHSMFQGLDAESFATRQNAALRLLDAATNTNHPLQQRFAVQEHLRRGLNHPSLEVRVQSFRLLQQIDQAAVDAQFQQLLNPKIDPNEVDLVGWRAFSELVGDDTASRQFYARLYLGHQRQIEHLIRQQNAAVTTRLGAAGASESRYPAANHDLDRWALVLFADSILDPVATAYPSSRLMMSLAHSGMGPCLGDDEEDELIRRLIHKWLLRHRELGSVCDQLRIAMRYRCDSLAMQLCRRILEDPHSPAPWQTTAILAACVLSASHPGFADSELELNSLLESRLADKRTAHVWRLIPSRKTKIRTQVCDVAMTMLLYRHQIDPRSAGFADIQADPTLIYRDDSIGFGDESEREAAHQTARKRLLERDYDVESFSRNEK